MTPASWPTCPSCGDHPLLPLSDYGDGAPVRFKAWACPSSSCGHVLRIDAGTVTRETPGGGTP